MHAWQAMREAGGRLVHEEDGAPPAHLGTEIFAMHADQTGHGRRLGDAAAGCSGSPPLIYYACGDGTIKAFCLPSLLQKAEVL